jgi:signal transduction histidine kinase
MKANPLDDGIGDTLVSPAFDDATLISHGKRGNLRTRIKELNLEPSIGNGDVGERTFVGIWSSDPNTKRHHRLIDEKVLRFGLPSRKDPRAYGKRGRWRHITPAPPNSENLRHLRGPMSLELIQHPTVLAISSSEGVVAGLSQLLTDLFQSDVFEVPVADLDPTYDELSARLHFLEESLQKSEKLAIAGRYAGAVMHEVNNPLEAIGNLVFLTKNLANAGPEVRQNMQVVESQLARLGEITRKTLSFYREETEAKDFDLVEIAEAALRIHLQRRPAKELTVTREFPERVVVYGRAGEILQVVSNLLLNSLQALPAQDASIRLRIRKVGNQVNITIADNGHGIPRSLHDSLFRPHITARRGGTGIGLWLSKQIVDRHRGRIRFRSSQRMGRNGTVFTLMLPLRQTDQVS